MLVIGACGRGNAFGFGGSLDRRPILDRGFVFTVSEPRRCADPSGAGGDARATAGDGGPGGATPPSTWRRRRGRSWRSAPRGPSTGCPSSISDEVSLGGEQGLLGLAFAPGGGELYDELHGHERRHPRHGVQRCEAIERIRPRGATSSSWSSRTRTTTAATSCSVPTASCTSVSVTGGAGEIRMATASRSPRCSARCSGSTRSSRAKLPSVSRRTTRSSAARTRDRRSGPTGSATRGGTRSID